MSREYEKLSEINPLLKNISKSYLRGWVESTRILHLNTVIDASNQYITAVKTNLTVRPELTESYNKEWLEVRGIILKTLSRLQAEADYDIAEDIREVLPLQKKGTAVSDQSLTPIQIQALEESAGDSSDNSLFPIKSQIIPKPPAFPFLTQTTVPAIKLKTVTQLRSMAAEFLKLASTIVSIHFDGDPSKLAPFLDSLTLLESVVGVHTGLAVSFVKTRLVGRARDLITNEDTILEIKNKLKNNIKVQSSAELMAKLAGVKPGSKIIDFCKQVDDLADSLRRSFLSEGVALATAEAYVTREVTKTLIAVAPDQHTKTVLEAKSFNSPQEVTAYYTGLAGEVQKAQQILGFRGGRGGRNGNYRGGRGRQNNRYRNNDNHNNNYNNNYYNNNNNNNHGRGRRRGHNRGRNNYVRSFENTNQNDQGNSTFPRAAARDLQEPN